MEIRTFLETMMKHEASDVYLTTHSAPMYRIDGVVQPIGEEVFRQADLEQLANSIMNERQQKEFQEKHEMNLAMSLPGVSRFRVNIFRQRGSAGMVIRRVKVEIASLEELGMPAILKDIVMTDRKSTRLNSSHIQKSRMPSSA